PRVRRVRRLRRGDEGPGQPRELPPRVRQRRRPAPERRRRPGDGERDRPPAAALGAARRESARPGRDRGGLLPLEPGCAEANRYVTDVLVSPVGFGFGTQEVAALTVNGPACTTVVNVRSVVLELLVPTRDVVAFEPALPATKSTSRVSSVKLAPPGIGPLAVVTIVLPLTL